MNSVSCILKAKSSFVIGINIGTYGFGYSIVDTGSKRSTFKCIASKRYYTPLTFDKDNQVISTNKPPTCFSAACYTIPSITPTLHVNKDTNRTQALQLTDEKGEYRNAVEILESILKFIEKEVSDYLSRERRSYSNTLWNITINDDFLKFVLIQASRKVILPPNKTYFVKEACALSAFCDVEFKRFKTDNDSCLIVDLGASKVKTYVHRGCDTENFRALQKQLLEADEVMSKIFDLEFSSDFLDLLAHTEETNEILSTVLKAKCRSFSDEDTKQLKSKMQKLKEAISIVSKSIDASTGRKKKIFEHLKGLEKENDEMKTSFREALERSNIFHKQLLTCFSLKINICIDRVWGTRFLFKGENTSAAENFQNSTRTDLLEKSKAYVKSWRSELDMKQAWYEIKENTEKIDKDKIGKILWKNEFDIREPFSTVSKAKTPRIWKRKPNEQSDKHLLNSEPDNKAEETGKSVTKHTEVLPLKNEYEYLKWVQEALLENRDTPKDTTDNFCDDVKKILDTLCNDFPNWKEFDHSVDNNIDACEKFIQRLKTERREIFYLFVERTVNILADFNCKNSKIHNNSEGINPFWNECNAEGSNASSKITTHFESYMENLVGKPTWEKFKSQYPLDYLEMSVSFEEKKASFQNYKNIDIALPQSLISITADLDKNIKHILEENGSKDNYEKDRQRLLLSHETVQSFFDPEVDAIIETLTKPLVSYMGTRKLSAIVLVGGLADSAYVRKSVQDKLNQKVQQLNCDNVEIIWPLNGREAAQAGAALVSSFQEIHSVCSCNYCSKGMWKE